MLSFTSKEPERVEIAHHNTPSSIPGGVILHTVEITVSSEHGRSRVEVATLDVLEAIFHNIRSDDFAKLVELAQRQAREHRQ